MKLRIHNNSIRIRVTQSETARLGAGEKIEQITEFSKTQRLICSVEPSPHASLATAEFSTGHIAVFLPRAQASAWANSDTVAIEASQPIDSERSLQILVEKDFECLHSQGEENADAFPNPRR